jgi:phospholipid/cholesterol/gamma-HCH transport system substrate-binding protein
MNSRFVKFFFGIFVVLILVELMFVDRHNSNDNYYDLLATFNKIDGVNEGILVMISGVTIGYVDEVMLNKNYPVLKMKIKKGLRISDDSSVSIQTDGLFGSKFLSIEMGGNDNYLVSGDSFSFAEDSMLIQDLLTNIIQLGEKNKK